MKQWAPFLLTGLTAGAVYALAAMGLVVTYTTSGVFNFAHGAVGMAGAFAFYTLRVEVGIPTWMAAAVVIGVFAPLVGVLIDRVLLSSLKGATASTYVVVSLGLLVLIQGVILKIYSGNTRRFDPLFPTSTFEVAGVRVGYDQMIVILISVAAALALGWFFGHTHLGLQMRAVVDSPDLTGMVGANPAWIRTISWVLGCTFATISAILFAPVVGLDVAILTLVVVQAFGAAAVGRLTSLPLTFAGAMGIGLLASAATKLVVDLGIPELRGLPSSIPFLVLFAVLVMSRKGRFAGVTGTRAIAPKSARRATRRNPWPFVAALGAMTVMLPHVVTGDRVYTATQTVCFVLIFASLGLLVGVSRQLSLCHAVFVALGATTLSHLLDAGVPYPLALLASGLLLMPVGALIAIPAIRLSGLFLALATFGFGILAQSLIFDSDLGFGAQGYIVIERPTMLGLSFASDTAWYYFAAAVCAIGVGAIALIRVTRLGRLLRGIGDSPTALAALGVSTLPSLVLVFCIAAFLGGIAGGLLGTQFQSVNPVSFNFFQSLIWLAVLVTCGAGSLVGAALAALVFVAVPGVINSASVTEYQPIVFGLLTMALAQSPDGLIGLVQHIDFGARARANQWRVKRSPAAQRMAH